MLGMGDFWVGLAYLLCILSSILCVVYGLTHWNKGDEPLAKEDEKWAVEEDRLEQEL